MAFRTALSGLNAASTELNITGNNVANVNTPNFQARPVDAVQATRPETSDQAKSAGMASSYTDPYHGEGLGPYRHSVTVDPATMYNWYQDPLNLKSNLDRSAPATEQVTRYETYLHGEAVAVGAFVRA